MELYLIRHAKSDHNPQYESDYIRPLSDRGRREQEVASRKMKELNMYFDLAWYSGLKRAEETLAIILKIFQKRIPIEVKSEFAVNGNTQNAIKLLRKAYEMDNTLDLTVVSHNPTVSHIASVLSGKNIRMRESEVIWFTWRGKTPIFQAHYAQEELF